MSFDVASYLIEKKTIVDGALRTRWVLPVATDPAKLHESVQYSLFADGKRIRPALVFAAAHALGLSDEDVLPAAAALEMIHVFSLVHDDLPAMDDDDLRRGQPTNHKVYGEAVAILAGDALLSHAFAVLADSDRQKFSADAILELIRFYAEATGWSGMIAGQVVDLESEGKTIDLNRLRKLHALKTGALIRAAVLAPVILSTADIQKRSALSAYGDAIGLAFQIADDILDVEGGVEIGKDIGSDAARGKSTYVSLLGLDEAKKQRTQALNAALAALEGFGPQAEILRALAEFIVARKK